MFPENSAFIEECAKQLEEILPDILVQLSALEEAKKVEQHVLRLVIDV